MKQYRVGIIGRTGKGNYGHGLDTVWKDAPERFAVAAVADENSDGLAKAVERTGAIKGYADYREMLQRERLDIVAICPRWIDQHFEMGMAAAEQGCHVYMEKPFCPTLEQADELVRAFEMKHLKLAMAYQSRYSPIVNVVKRLMKEGAIGAPLEVRGRGKEDARGGGEDLWVLGSHVLDLFRAFFGDAKSCSAVVRTGGRDVGLRDIAPGNEGLGPLAGDEIHAEYEFDNSLRGYFSTVRGKGGNPSRFGLQIFGSEGIIDFYTNYLTPAAILRDPGWSPGRTGKQWENITSAGIGLPEVKPNVGMHGGNLAAINDLTDAIEQDRQPLANIEGARASQELILAIFESHRLGRRVELPLQNRLHPLTQLT